MDTRARHDGWQMEKAVQKVAIDFEREIDLGYQMDNHQTFAQYAEYVLELKERAGAKHKTVHEYRLLTGRINASIGHIKLTEIHPQHLNAFYKAIGEKGVHKSGQRASRKVDLGRLLEERGVTRETVSIAAGVSPSTVTVACREETSP